jgi:hypothetical protein
MGVRSGSDVTPASGKGTAFAAGATAEVTPAGAEATGMTEVEGGGGGVVQPSNSTVATTADRPIFLSRG